MQDILEQLRVVARPLSILQPRKPDGHKGDYGHALLIGGSRGMAGSISLTTGAALHAGAGLVTQAIPECILDTVAILNPSAMSLPLTADSEGRISANAWSKIESHYTKSKAIACGPGLGTSTELQQFVTKLYEASHVPVVFDADALNNLANVSQWPGNTAQITHILTPHPGEWSRICGVSAKNRFEQMKVAVEFAKQHQLVIVLKGNHTFVTDGEFGFLNSSGTPAMATGGSGDVLTGIITALVCQGLSPFDAAQLGVHVHGLAGEIAEKELASHVVVASELIHYIGRAIRRLQRT